MCLCRGWKPSEGHQATPCDDRIYLIPKGYKLEHANTTRDLEKRWDRRFHADSSLLYYLKRGVNSRTIRIWRFWRILTLLVCVEECNSAWWYTYILTSTPLLIWLLRECAWVMTRCLVVLSFVRPNTDRGFEPDKIKNQTATAAAYNKSLIDGQSAGVWNVGTNDSWRCFWKWVIRYITDALEKSASENEEVIDRRLASLTKVSINYGQS